MTDVLGVSSSAGSVLEPEPKICVLVMMMCHARPGRVQLGGGGKLTCSKRLIWCNLNSLSNSLSGALFSGSPFE